MTFIARISARHCISHLSSCRYRGTYLLALSHAASRTFARGEKGQKTNLTIEWRYDCVLGWLNPLRHSTPMTRDIDTC